MTNSSPQFPKDFKCKKSGRGDGECKIKMIGNLGGKHWLGG